VFEPVHEQCSIGHAGQPVVGGLVRQRFLALSATCHVARDHHDCADLPVSKDWVTHRIHEATTAIAGDCLEVGASVGRTTDDCGDTFSQSLRITRDQVLV
jgi:hypothetical protein